MTKVARAICWILMRGHRGRRSRDGTHLSRFVGRPDGKYECGLRCFRQPGHVAACRIKSQMCVSILDNATHFRPKYPTIRHPFRTVHRA